MPPAAAAQRAHDGQRHVGLAGVRRFAHLLGLAAAGAADGDHGARDGPPDHAQHSTLGVCACTHGVARAACWLHFALLGQPTAVASTAVSLLSIADCRLPIADCRLPLPASAPARCSS